MTWVKICGMTNLEDALLAVEAGADAVGFVFYEKSPRCVTADQARPIVDGLPANIEKVGVFVNDSEERIRAIAADVRLTSVQLYGQPATDSKRSEDEFPLRIDNFKVIVAMPSEDFRPGHLFPFSLPGAMIDAILIDSGSKDIPGGTGTKFDWTKNRDFIRGVEAIPGMRIIVAGGLTPQNVSDAIEILAPWGVDVVSGVEARPGKKDPQKVRAFVNAVREMDRKAS